MLDTYWQGRPTIYLTYTRESPSLQRHVQQMSKTPWVVMVESPVMIQRENAHLISFYMLVAWVKWATELVTNSASRGLNSQILRWFPSSFIKTCKMHYSIADIMSYLARRKAQLMKVKSPVSEIKSDKYIFTFSAVKNGFFTYSAVSQRNYQPKSKKSCNGGSLEIHTFFQFKSSLKNLIQKESMVKAECHTFKILLRHNQHFY